MSATSRGWCVELDRVWDVLGPFPIHAREQHFLSPAYPLDLSRPIDTTTRYPTSLTHSADASWSQTTADPHGVIHVSHPSVPWDQIRATEGWAGLQHLNVLRGWLSVRPPSSLSADTSEPLLRIELLQGAFFTVLPPPDSSERRTRVPEWHHGNIYALERAPAQLVKLPVSPTKNKEGEKYEIIICAPYEIRLFGDPSAYSSPHPALTLNFSLSLQFPCSPTHWPGSNGIQLPADGPPLQQALGQSITPHIVDGTPFGDAIGIGVECLDFGLLSEGYWSVVRARLVHNSALLPPSLSVTLLDEAPIRIVPTQTRIIPLWLCISSQERISKDLQWLNVELTCVRSMTLLGPMERPLSDTHDNSQTIRSTFVLQTSLPLTHTPIWTREKHVPILASYFFAKSMPTGFLVKPPKDAFGDFSGLRDDARKCRGNEPILALHGAGVDILSQTFWPDSLLRQKYAWVVMPRGLTAWGLDWHGPSAADAFATISALSWILSDSGSGRWAKWGFSTDTRVILMGHSNGGQGAWYMASRWPDRVCAVVPAAGYIKSQAYVSWNMAHFAHFVDPALRAVLDSSLTPDDDDLLLGNLTGKPILALHGGADDNVPPWHTREQVGILKTWDPNADVTYYEDPGQPHWYPGVLSNKRVQDFLDRVYSLSSSPRHAGDGPSAHETEGQMSKKIFTLTVAVPAESGSLNGWQIRALTIPGLLGRIRVTSTHGQVSTVTTNTSVFSLDLQVFCITYDAASATALTIDGDHVPIDVSKSVGSIVFARDANTAGPHHKSHWKVQTHTDSMAMTIQHLRAPRQRLQSILSTTAPLTLLVPSLAPSQEFSAALRIAHVLHLFHALDAQIVSVSEVETTPASREGNLVVIGCAESPLVREWLDRAGGTWRYADGAWQLRVGVGAALTRFERPSSAILFCQPHPYDVGSVALFVQSTDAGGLERAVRLFPIRTGVVSPDWLVVDGRADTIGAAGVQGTGVYGWTPPEYDRHKTADTTGDWVWNERMSWLD